MNTENRKGTPTDSGPARDDAAKDTDSDPAKGADDKSDWSDEGGATPSGPAGDTDA